ncbi:MAG TPA: MaoC/PaaZ C-terminal domain-containing protein [Azospirillum sp.]|nr:MaoC/PaaZ C-terminal domain-containing protein [Azospirillum sp.]
MAQDVRFADIEVGQSIPEACMPTIGPVQLALFAAASADHNPIHLDEQAAKAGGLPGVIAHGMLSMALLGRMLTRWVPQRRIRHFSARFTAMAVPGDALTCKGVVTAKREVDGERLVDLEIHAENQRGERIVAGHATVALP